MGRGAPGLVSHERTLRRLVALKRKQGMPAQKIAKMLGVPVSTVKRHIAALED